MLVPVKNIPNCQQSKFATSITPGVFSALFHYIVRDQQFKIISDTKMTQEGVNSWLAMIRKNLLNISVIDIDIITNKKYTPTAAKNEINDDGVTILSPERDTDENNQRFFYLAEEVLLVNIII